MVQGVKVEKDASRYSPDLVDYVRREFGDSDPSWFVRDALRPEAEGKRARVPVWRGATKLRRQQTPSR